MRAGRSTHPRSVYPTSGWQFNQGFNQIIPCIAHKAASAKMQPCCLEYGILTVAKLYIKSLPTDEVKIYSGEIFIISLTIATISEYLCQILLSILFDKLL